MPGVALLFLIYTASWFVEDATPEPVKVEARVKLICCMCCAPELVFTVESPIGTPFTYIRAVISLFAVIPAPLTKEIFALATKPPPCIDDISGEVK